MNNIEAMILCEGETDQILLGLYLEGTSNYSYFANHEYDKMFSSKSINWYKDNEKRIIGIWDNGGNQFDTALNSICFREKSFEHIINHIVVVTDYDDENAMTERSQGVYGTVFEGLGVDKGKIPSRICNVWHTVFFDNPFGSHCIKLCYLLVPLDKVGALETFMLDSMTENNPEQSTVIEQARTFIENLKTDVYLTHRRDKTKALLGVSLSIFNPERIFRIMNEILKSVSWDTFETSNKQFALFSDFLGD